MAERTLNPASLILGAGTVKIDEQDVGSFKNLRISINREEKVHEVGLPLTVDKAWIVRESAEISMNLEEIDRKQLEWVFGGTFDSETKTLKVGGVQVFPVHQVEITLKRDDGSVIITIPRAQPAGSVEWPIEDTEIQSLPLTMKCLQDPTDLSYMAIKLDVPDN